MAVRDDFLVVNVTAGKRALVKCLAVSKDGKRAKARLAADTDEAPTFDLVLSEVVANLGKSPSVGSVYGLQIEPLRERIASNFWGEIQIFCELDDKRRKDVQLELKEARAKVEKLNLPPLPLLTQIKTRNSKMLGFYKYRPKADADILCVKVEEDICDMQYKLGHEYAHGIWFRNFLPKMRMAWVNMYHDSLDIAEVTDAELTTILDDLKTYGDLPGFLKENPDLAATMRAVFRHIKQTHSLEKSHFQMALMLGEDIEQYWPSSLELAEKQVLLTEYAQKSPEELWAEAFGLKFSGKKLPAKIDALLEKCLRTLVK